MLGYLGVHVYLYYQERGWGPHTTQKSYLSRNPLSGGMLAPKIIFKGMHKAP